MAQTYLESVAADPEQMKLYQEERLMVEVTELICRELKKQNLRRSELADKLGKSKGRISQYLDGERNLTLRTVADIFTALGFSLRVDVEPINSRCDEQEPIILRCVQQAWERPTWNLPADEVCPVTAEALAG